MQANPYWAPRIREKAELIAQGHLPEFRRNNICRYIDNSFPHNTNTLQLYRQKFWPLIPDSLKYLAEDTDRGLPERSTIDGILVTAASIEYAYMAYTMQPCIGVMADVVEIGGGFGGLARAVMKLKPDIRYTIIDFPPLLEIQRYYLEGIDGVKFLPAGSDPGRAVTFFVNTRGLGEMDLWQVEHYIKIIERRLVRFGAFYCVNRAHRITNLDSYPMDERWRRVIDRGWPLSRQGDMREILFVRQ